VRVQVAETQNDVGVVCIRDEPETLVQETDVLRM
jgi:hypothetical protein